MFWSMLVKLFYMKALLNLNASPPPQQSDKFVGIGLFKPIESF